jgi:hypothetical protein
MELEEAVLRYLASEEFCSISEIEEVARLRGATAAEMAQLLGRWRSQGWLDSVPQRDPQLPSLLRLSNRAFAAHPWLAQAT